MTRESEWQRLVEALDAWTSASEIGAGRIQVTVPGRRGSRRAVIVMRPDEWDDMTGPMFGSFEDALNDVKRSLRHLRPHERFAVYSQYRLEGSVSASLPARTDFLPGGDR